MIFYLDTEFNDFKGALISIALVDENGTSFYQSLGCESPSAWVDENVMPVINSEPIPKMYMQGLLGAFLCNYSSAHIVADWPEDIQHFCELLITGPGQRIHTPHLSFEIRRDLANTSDESAIPHNALEDARALRRMALDAK